MIRLKHQGIGLGAHLGLKLGKIINVKSLELSCHLKEDVREYLRVVTSPVVVEASEIVMLCQIIELVRFKLGIKISGERHRIKIRQIKRNIQCFCRRADKACIKISVVSDEQSVADKL